MKLLFLLVGRLYSMLFKIPEHRYVKSTFNHICMKIKYCIDSVK